MQEHTASDLRCPLCNRPVLLGAATCANCEAPLQFFPAGQTVLAWDKTAGRWVGRSQYEGPPPGGR